MERCADRKRNGTLCAALFRKLARIGHSILFTGYCNLTRTVKVCRLNNALFRCVLTDAINRVRIQLQNRRHRADADRIDVVEMRALELDLLRPQSERLVDDEVGDQRAARRAVHVDEGAGQRDQDPDHLQGRRPVTGDHPDQQRHPRGAAGGGLGGATDDKVLQPRDEGDDERERVDQHHAELRGGVVLDFYG